MSAASEPAPRSKSDIRIYTNKYTAFLPIFIFFIGAGALALYQVMTMEEQYEQMTRSIDKMDDKVKRAQYEKAKFFRIARDVLHLSAKDPNAELIAAHYKLHQLEAEQPELVNANTPSDIARSNMDAPKPEASTNAAPLVAAPVTNAAPVAK